MRILVGLTGASGLPYGRRLVTALLEAGHQVDVVATEAASQVAAQEMHWALDVRDPARSFEGVTGFEKLRGISLQNIGGCHASGSSGPEAVVICPCSMNSLARLAHGLGDRAHERAFSVALKENRPAVVVPREMPFSRIDLKNMLALDEAGARVMPACPGFWHQPQSVADLVDFVVERVGQALGLQLGLVEAWKG